MTLPDMEGWSAEEIEVRLRDAQLWEGTVREIARREGIHFTRIEAGSESSSAAFLLDDIHVLKIFQPENALDADVEAEVLEALAGEPSVPSPRLRSRGIVEHWPYLLMDCVPGVPLRELLHDLDPKDLDRIAAEVGDSVRAMHELGDAMASVLSRLGRGMAHTAAMMCAVREQAFRTLQDLFPQRQHNGWLNELAAALDSEWDSFFADRGVLLNLDLTEDHVYLLESSGRWRLSGLIDFADAAIGPCELDWHDVRFWMLGRRTSAMRAFLHAYWGRRVTEQDVRRSFLLNFCVPNIDYGLRHDIPPDGRAEVRSVDDLQEILWPGSICTRSQ